MVQAGGRQHGTFGQTKVGMEVHGVGGVDELRVPHRVAGVLIHPRVETGVIVVTDLFPRGGGAMQLHHVGASAKEHLARLQRGLEAQGRHVVGHLGLVLQSPVPVAFPHLHHRVPAVSQRLDFGLGGAIGVFHGPVQGFLALGMTAGTAVPIAAVKLVDGARGGIVAVDSVAGARDAELALVPCMLERAVQLGFHPPQPLQGHVGVVGAGTPTLQGFGGDDVGLHAVGAQIAVASRSDGHLIEGVEMRQGFEITLEGQTPLLEQFDVRLAVGQEFLLEIERHPTRHLVSIPPFEILPALDAHAVGKVGVLGWQGPHVVLVGPGVEEVGEIPFLQFGQAKGLGKGRQGHLKEGQGVDEANVPHLQLQDLGAISGLFQQSLLTVVFLHQGVAIIALKIVGQHRQGTFGLFCQVVQPGGELLETGLALETKGLLLHFGFGHHQVRNVLSILLSTFDVKEDVEGCWGGFILGWCHLHEAAVALNLHVLLAGRTGGIPAAVFLTLFSSPQQFQAP